MTQQTANHTQKLTQKKQLGYITAALLVSAGTATIVLYGLAFLVINQYQILQRQHHSSQAIAIAEAGLNYYRWHLAHAPNDFTDGTGNVGPYVHNYSDPQSGIIGSYSLEITPPSSGESIVSIKSTGYTTIQPDIKRTITAQYGKPSMAQYAFLHDSNVWFGSGLTINGQAHSNKGIRNDGTNNSLVTSALAIYTCDSSSGCNPSQTKTGVWGAGGDQGLWQYPVTTIDFNSISVDFNTMKSEAQLSGLYLAASGNWGYHLIFNTDGTLQVYRVTNAGNLKGYDESGCMNLYQNITNQVLVNTYQTNTLPLIFAEDHLWIEGTITNSIQIVAARFPIETNAMNIWIYNNVLYPAKDGTVQAGVIAQNSIYFARNIPTNFEIDAALLAQKGNIMRHNYNNGSCSSSSYAVRNSLTLYGSIISSRKSYWNWGTSPTSGFVTRNITYDPNLRYTPPPHFPTAGSYEFISWSE